MLGKCYLELPPRDSSAPAQSGRLQFLGFKWSINDGSVAVVSRYRSMLMNNWSDLSAQMIEASGSELAAVMQSLLGLFQPAAECTTNRCELLEIAEEGTERRSWDLNVYDRDLKLCSIGDALSEAATVFGVASKSVTDWLQKSADASVGHIATGRGRNGDQFLTVYFGARSGL